MRRRSPGSRRARHATGWIASIASSPGVETAGKTRHSYLTPRGQASRRWRQRAAKRLDVREPGAVALLAAAHDREEDILQAAGDRPRRAVADAPVVELADRRHLGRRAREERLVREVDLVAREALLARRDAHVDEQAEDRVAGDAAEHGGQRRRLHRPLAHDEDVLAARLGDVAVDVEEERLLVARGTRLARGEDGVHVVAGRLRLGEQRVRMEAREGARLHPDAALHALVAQV